MRVIGIDIAPRRGGHVCDGGEKPVRRSPRELERYLDQLKGDVLLAWDAPLTGPPDLNGWTSESDLTMRQIEQFFGSGLFKTPEGISVRGYAGCPHWTISRRLVGLPRIGRYDSSDVPFKLATNNAERPISGKNIVEVHPAVALWLWCRRKGAEEQWIYKGKPGAQRRQQLCAMMARMGGSELKDYDDDQLDAWLAWYLADCWIRREGVMLLGNARTGSFLLPKSDDLQQAFDRFVSAPRRDQYRWAEATLECPSESAGPSMARPSAAGESGRTLISRSALDVTIGKLTRPLNGQYPRPWITDSKKPQKAEAFIIGLNQATPCRESDIGDHGAYLDALYNRNGRSCRELYMRMRAEKSPSPTRKNSDRLRECLRAAGIVDILETNVICYSTPRYKDLSHEMHRGGKERGSEIFRTLLEMIQPPILIAHGAKTREELSRVLGTDLPVTFGYDVVSAGRIGSSYKPMVFVLPSLSPPEWNKWHAQAEGHFAVICKQARRLLARRDRPGGHLQVPAHGPFRRLST